MVRCAEVWAVWLSHPSLKPTSQRPCHLTFLPSPFNANTPGSPRGWNYNRWSQGYLLKIDQLGAHVSSLLKPLTVDLHLTNVGTTGA